MIQTKFPITYGDRLEKFGHIRIEAREMEPNSEFPAESGTRYLAIDWELEDIEGVLTQKKDAKFSKIVFYSADKINLLDSFLESSNDFTGLTRVQKELKKISIGLMVETQTNLYPNGKTIYQLNPEDWEFTE